MPQMTCPVCKNHCLLTVEEQAGTITVSGNKCDSSFFLCA